MTTLSLGAVFLNAAADLSDFARFDSPTGLQVNDDANGQVRTMANGRTRLVLTAGEPVVASLSLLYLERSDVNWLLAHKKTLLCFRDHLGRKFYGAYLSVPVEEIKYVNDRADLSLTITKVTHSEAVT